MIDDSRTARRAGARSEVAVLSGAGALATACWLIPASVHIVQWPAEGPVRLALLAPAWQLGAWLLAAVAVAGLVLVHGRRTSGTVGRATLACGPGEAAAPLSLLWAWAIPYLPWLPDRLPLLLVLAGPARWALAAIALAAVVLRSTGWRPQRWPAPARGTLFAISLLLYVGLGLHAARLVGLGGDEPHYLIISESLLRDGDLKIDNNHERGDYRVFWPSDLRPDYFVRGKNGAIYSIHAPGLPALILPAYAAGGRMGVVALIGLLAALASLAVYDLASEVAGRGAAFAAWAGCCLTVPFVPYAWMIFPEMPGALLVAWSALWLWRSADRPAWVWAVRGLALSALPWLHTKFVVFLAVFAAALAVRLLRRLPALVAFALPLAASTAAWLYSFYAIYGSWSPEAPYGDYSRLYVLNQNIPHGLLGILFDQKFGLLVYSPIYLLAPVGGWLAVRHRETRMLGVVLLASIAGFMLSTARLYMFWGGSSAPARFLVPLLPCLAPFVAMSVQVARTPVSRALVGVWLGISLGLALVGVFRPEQLLLFSDPHGRARVLEWLQAGSPLSLVVPTFTEPSWTSNVGALATWLAVGALALAVVGVVGRGLRATGGHLAGAGSAVFLIFGAITTARPPEPVRSETAARGAQDVWWRFDGTRLRTLDYRTLGRVSPDRLRALTTIAIQADPNAGRSWASGPLSLPPGTYVARIRFGEGAPPESEAQVVALPDAILGHAALNAADSASIRFTLPIAARRVVVRPSPASRTASLAGVQIVPEAVVAPGERPAVPIRALESLLERDGALLAYTDEHAYPEGGVFWSRGTEATRVMVVPAGATRLSLTLSTGPMNGTVTVAVGGQTRSVAMAAGELKVVSFELPASEGLVPVDVQSSVMFRPAEVDARSTDRRGLGCQVRIHLE